MRLNETLTYRADPASVFAMLCDKSWRERVCELAHADSYDVTVESAGDATTVTVRRVLPAEVPDAVRKFLGSTIEVTQTERWGTAEADGTRRSGVDVRIAGQPASMEGTSVLRGTADTSTLTVAGDVRVKIPIVGRKVEPEVTKAIVAALRIEEKAAVDYLTPER